MVFRSLYKRPINKCWVGIPEFELDDDFDGISFMIWEGVDDIIDDSTKYEPGISALKDGFIFVASCSHGSGDPIFINVTSDQPGLFRYCRNEQYC